MAEQVSSSPGATAGVNGACQDAVPSTKADRDRLLAVIRQYLGSRRSVPPFSVDELRDHADRVLAAAAMDEKHRKFAAVLVSNEAWRDTVAAVPYAHRLLLLPKCLRSVDHCAGTMDAFGLVCGECGRCPIYDLKTEAERLGYVVLVAEGAAVVMSLIQTRKIEAVVGVSCLSALESIYPLMESAAVPGIAIPLLYSGCVSTAVDLDWVWEAIQLTTSDRPRLDLDALRGEVESWFTAEALDAALGPAAGETERIARTWLAKSGKRWRPFLVACTFQAFRGDPEAPLPEAVRRVALAVECFHKASLVHDDIEDEDALRYGEKTLHEAYGIPIALNVGDFLLGEGYRLIGEADVPADRKAEMLRVAAHGHRDLTIGQGAELCWARRPAPLATAEVLEIFRRKTAPAFEVALRLGALAAGTEDGVWDTLHRYSEALGIAYQIRDDLKDWHGHGEPDDAGAMRPSILLAVAYERAAGARRRRLADVWRRSFHPGAAAPEVRRLLDDLGTEAETRRLLTSHKDEAIRSLDALPSLALKGLLRRVVFKIFYDIGQGSPPGESAAGHAPGRAAGA
jgi:geranylgeranyl pyrophosphate synthase